MESDDDGDDDDVVVVVVVVVVPIDNALDNWQVFLCDCELGVFSIFPELQAKNF